MKISAKLFATVTMLMLAAGCDKFYTYKFIIKNQSDYEVSVFVKTKNIAIADTIKCGEQITVFDDFSSKSNLYCKDDFLTLDFFDSIQINRIDSNSPLKKNIVQCSNWKIENYEKGKESFIDFLFVTSKNDF